MSVVRVEISGDGILETLNSDGVREELMQIGESMARSLSAEAATHLHSPMRVDLYEADLRQLNVPVCTIHSHTLAGAAIGRKHGLPHK